jgi:hypothetical protein
MRIVEKISPTSLHLWESDREAFYMKYLSDARPPRLDQTGAMAVGSAFDAFVKCALHHHLFGNEGASFVDRDGNDTGVGIYNLKRLFEEQVDNPEIRPWAWEAGKYCFDSYVTWGNYNSLLQELMQSEEDPRFEFELRGEIAGVPLVGKPDLWYKRAVQVIYDWKVMGYCSKSANSPKKFYKTCRDCWGMDRAKPTRGGGQPKAHKGYEEIDHKGHLIGSHWLEQVDKKWADQISIYSWMMGVEVGDDTMVAGLDQLCCKPAPDPEANRNPLIRVAQHRCRISKEWQEKLQARLQAMWSQLQSGHIFDDLSREDSDARCEVMDMPQPEGDDEFWGAVNERQYRG